MELQFSDDNPHPLIVTLPKAIRTKATIMSSYEKEFLMRLVSSHMDIVTSRQTDFATILKKKRTWQKIAHEFCSDEATTKRTSVQLKKAWENLKTRAKHEVVKCFKPAKSEPLSGPSIASTQEEENVVSFVETQEPQTSKARHSSDDRTAKGSDFEAVEHKMRMKTLTLKHDMKEKQWKRDMQMREEEHRMKMRVYEAQLLYYQNVLGCTGMQNSVETINEEPLLIIHDNQ